ncbi:MAG: elongation factor P hydroxylase [Oleiphilaceae bacterium]|nr:elongation factor P hydroxylase [Oleiphilaceae bacterium]
MKHHSDDLIMLFHDLFRDKYRTQLVKGGSEPEYTPAAGPGQLARVVFTHDFYASALHEVSHWCIAGARRRGLTDYGYWYCPDGRTPAQQVAFEAAEIRPQALEWLFSVAAGSAFHISLDNLDGEGSDEPEFRRKVTAQANAYLGNGMPERAGMFHQALLTFYGRRACFLDLWNAGAHH